MNRKRFLKISALLICFIFFTALLLSSCGNNNENEGDNGMDNDKVIDNGDGTFTTKVNVNNPILAGFHADPSAYKFGDTYYIYATTDGYVLGGNAGWPMIWKSKDFVNWEAKPMELLRTNGSKFTDAEAYFWAPTMLLWNGIYYLIFTQGDFYTMIAAGDNPEGPFTVQGTLFRSANGADSKDKTIDAQAFLDDDGRAYLVYLLRENNIDNDDHLYTAICELDQNNITKVKEIRKISELSHHYREGQEIFKKDGKYYLLYSEGSWMTDSYHIKYAIADNVYGPYTIIGTILESPGDGQIIGTGHHSTLKDGDRYFIVYHRQSIPFRGFGFRQICADEMLFNDDGTIKSIKASYEGVEVPYRQTKKEFELINVAKNAKLSTEEPIESRYIPDYLVNGDFSNLWKTLDRKGEKSITLELDDLYDIYRTEIYFEFGSKYYSYKIEMSKDGESWELFADRSDDKTKETPRVDKASDEPIMAKFVKLTIVKTESLPRNYGSKEDTDKPRWMEQERIGIFEFKVLGKKS